MDCPAAQAWIRVEAVLTMAHDVFISYSTKDKTVADAACATLEARGIHCWIAPRDVPPAHEWAAAIVEAIQGCQIFLLVFSHEAKASPQVRREVAQAANSGKQILTLRIEDVHPEGDLKYYLDGLHWLDAITKPLEAQLQTLVKECTAMLAERDASSDSTIPGTAPAVGGRPKVAWWRRLPAKVAVTAAVVVVLAGAGLLLRPSAAQVRVPSSGSAGPGSSLAAPAPTVNPAESNAARAQIVQLTGSWSDGGFHDATVSRDTNIVALYLKSGMKATTLRQGASVILYGFQGVSQNGDPIALMKTFQASGFKVDDQLEDSWLMGKLTNDMAPEPFTSPSAPKGYSGGYKKHFVGSLLFWILQRYLWVGNDQDVQVVNYLISQGADCKVPLAFLEYHSTALGGSLDSVVKSCAK